MITRHALCFILLTGFVIGCSEAPKGPPASESKSAPAEAGSQKNGPAANDAATTDEPATANTGGPTLIPPTVNPEPTAEKSALTHAVTKASEYYKTGPQQGRPPDGTFAVGTEVTIVESAGSYSKVRTEDGTEVFVATDALKPIAEDSQGK